MRSYVYLIRHGITEGNQKRWYYGASNLPLADEGKENLIELLEKGTYPAGEKADIYTSGLIRCEQTKGILYGDVAREIIDALKEIDCGDFECKSHEDLIEDARYIKWCSDKTGEVSMPGGESKNEFLQRVYGGFKELFVKHQLKSLSMRHKEEEAESIAIIHGGVICAIMFKHFGNGDEKTFWKWMPDPGRGWALIVEDGDVIDYERI